MNVIFDKLKSGEVHQLTTGEVKSIHKFLKSKFNYNANIYRLSNQSAEKSRFDRPVIYDFIPRKITVCLTDLSKDELIKEIFIEILQHNDPSLHAASYRHLSKTQRKQAEEKALQLFQEFQSVEGNVNA